MKEEWKDIKDYEGLYQISNYGRVKRIKFKNNKTEKEQTKYLKPNNYGPYLQIRLCKNGNPKPFYIHRLVAETFISNPNNLPQVNHKDENKYNNNVKNLEWCTIKYNNNYGTKPYKMSIIHKGKTNIKKRKSVIQYDKNGCFIKEYDGICTATKETGISKDLIIKNCRGKIKTAKGFVWKYKN